MSDPKKNTNKPAGKKVAKPTKRKQYTVPEAINIKVSSGSKAATRKHRRARKILAKKRQGYKAAILRMNRSRLALNTIFGKQKCFPGLSVYGGEAVQSKKRTWMCSVQGQLKFEEQNHATREIEVRVFVEGAEVSGYLRGTINWSIQTTGGMNTCAFTLNNNHDAFILTPANICSADSLQGWRVPRVGSRLITSPNRESRNVDETAKRIIYMHKWRRVRPKAKAKAQIDPTTGAWLYPLHPWHSIITKHDCVRVFARLPHITGVARFGDKKKTKVIEATEAWAPVFTGFVDEVDWEDDPVMGDRLMNVRCYDWRGLLDRMRVRIQGVPLVTESDAEKQIGNPIFDEQRKKSAKEGLFGPPVKGKNEATRFLNDMTRWCIAPDLIALYQAGFEVRVILDCKQGKQAECTKIVQKNIRQEIANEVAKLRDPKNGLGVWNRLVKAVAEASKADGVKRELSRECGIGNKLKLTTKGRGAADARKTVARNVVEWLKSTGVMLEKYVYQYAEAYVALNQARRARADKWKKAKLYDWRSPDWFIDTQPKKPEVFEIYNRLPAITDIDEKLRNENDALDALIYIERPTVNRAATLSDFIYKRVVRDFGGVTTAIKEQIDLTIEQAIPSRTLFAKRKVTNKVLGATTVKKIDTSIVIFAAKGTLGGVASKVVAAMQTWLQAELQGETGNRTDALTKLLGDFNTAIAELAAKLVKVETDAIKALKARGSARQRTQLDKLRKKIEAQHQQGRNNSVKKSVGPKADLFVTDARFNEATVGMYGDLVRAVKLGKHPLEGMSYEEGVLWLTLTHTPLTMGWEDKIKQYKQNALEKWNMMLVFGVIGRPLTYSEVTEMGRGTVMDLDVKLAPYSPIHAFVHLLLPAAGTGAQTLVQQDMTANTLNNTSYTYETRLQLLNQISSALDYQFFVSPAGDLVFEFPNYNALPFDFGKVFQGAYTILRGLRSFKFTPETGEMNTAWVLTGAENERLADDITSDVIIVNQFKKIVLVADLLARRVGIKTRHLTVAMPGVGAVLTGGRKPISTMIAFGLLEVQRELGRMAQASVQYDYRPYMLPNRPIHIVHRQRMALARTVNYSMTVPMGECTVTTDLHYIRSLMNDGSFRHIAGGHRLPVDYSGMFTGDVKHTLQYGAKPTGGAKAESAAMRAMIQGNRRPRSLTNWACGPFMKDRWIEASASYSDQVGVTFEQRDNYTAWTSGSSGQPGSLPIGPRGTYLARGYHRPAESDGAPDSPVVLQGTGIGRSDDRPDPSKQPNNPLYMGKLYNPWPYAIYTKKYGNKFSQWGFYRVITPSGRPSSSSKGKRGTFNKKQRTAWTRNHRGKLNGWHSGMDFVGVKKGTKAHTPITLYYVSGYIASGYSRYPNNSPWYVWETGPYLMSDKRMPDSIKKFVVRRSGKFISKPDPKAIMIDKPGWVLPAYVTPKYIEEGGTVPTAPKIPTTRKWWIDVRTRKLWEKTKIKLNGVWKPNIYVKPGGSTKAGLTIWGYGYASMPGAQSEKVACKLLYVHCEDFVIGVKKKMIGTYRGNKAEDHLVRADKPFCIVGSTGTDNIHLHLEMYIYPPGSTPSKLAKFSGGDTSAGAWKEVLKANAEFLRTQMKMKITAGNGLNSGKMNKSWKRYFDKANKFGGRSITTVDGATDFMLSRSLHYRDYTMPGKGRKVVTNPMFFFRPEQIIPDMKTDYVKYFQRHGNTRFQDDKTASTGQQTCSGGNAVTLQKISLEFLACLGQVRKKLKTKSNSKKKRARAKCKEKKNIALRKAKGGNKVTRSRKAGNAAAQRTQRKVDRRVAENTTTLAANPVDRD